MSVKHDLIIHCFGQWWKASIKCQTYWLTQDMTYPPVPITFSVILESKVILDLSTNEVIKGKSSPEQIKMEAWLSGELPTLFIDAKSFNRKCNAYHRSEELKRII